MSKWSKLQWLISSGVITSIFLNHLFAEKIAVALSFIARWISPSVVVIFFTTILIIWGVALLLLLEEKKEKPLFGHKIWRIMPAIVGGVLFLSFVLFLILGVTVLSEVKPSMRWILDISIVYFLSLFYFFILSIFIRYSTIQSNKSKILNAANTSVLILFGVLFFLPEIL